MKGLLVAVLILCAASGYAQTLRVYNWKDYIDPVVLAAFGRGTGIKVDYQTCTTAQELDEVQKTGRAFDLVVPSHFQLKRLIGEVRRCAAICQRCLSWRSAPALVPQASERHRLYFLEPLQAEHKRVIDQQWLSIKQQQRLHQSLSTELE